MLRRLLAAVVLLPLLGGLAFAAVLWITTDVPPPGAVRAPQASVLTWADGTELVRVAQQDRTSVPLEQVSPAARHAVLAAEDRDFYDEGALSLRGTARAFVQNLRSGEITQGGSTITQQYARAAFLDQERTWLRKAREAVVAVKLDRSRSKDEVLERYLNTVYFGRGAYGIEAAARTWFATSAADLTAPQGALLGALLRAPASGDPALAPEVAQRRWRGVVEAMAEQGWLDVPASSLAFPAVEPRRAGGNRLGGPDGYLVDMALDELADLGFGEDRVAVAGLRVETTFDLRAQSSAVHAVRSVTGPSLPAGVYRALASVEPGTGRVRAVFAGDDYVTRPFNAAVQGRALAGSSFKPFVLAAALQDGISLRTRYSGRSPQTFAGDYEVQNYGRGDGRDYGRIDLVTATAESVNTVYVPLGLEVGTERVADVATALGVTADLSVERELPSISLGVSAVSPLDQASAYATLAAGGVHAAPFVVERVVSRDGTVLHEAAPAPERVLEPAVAADVTYALQQVVDDGTGAAADLARRPVAGKTGTTDGNTAAWFVGYTPRLATAVALFSERPDVPLRGIAGRREVTGGSLPARIWQAYTADVLAGVPAAGFPDPAFVGGVPAPAPPPPEPSAAPAPRADDASRRTLSPPPPAQPAPPPRPEEPPPRDPPPEEPPPRDPPPEEPGPLDPLPVPEPEPEPDGPLDLPVG